MSEYIGCVILVWFWLAAIYYLDEKFLGKFKTWGDLIYLPFLIAFFLNVIASTLLLCMIVFVAIFMGIGWIIY